MAANNLFLLRANAESLDAEMKAVERDFESTTRFTQALNDLEEAATQYKRSGIVKDDAITRAFTILDDSCPGAALFLKRLGIDESPLLAWMQKKPFEGVADLRVLIQQAANALQLRREQVQQSISHLKAQVQADEESEQAEGTGTASDPAEARQADLAVQSKKKRRGRPARYKAAKDKKLYEDWKASGLTVKEFARKRGINHADVKAAAKRHRTQVSRLRKK